MPIEKRVLKTHELQDGDMREVELGGTKIMVARVKGKFYAIGAECTHYGGPLAEGALNGHRVVCPWHQAVFNVMNGNLEEPPALDAEPCYEVRVEGEDVIVKAPAGAESRRPPDMVRRDPADGRTLVILGAGAAGNAAAETLRQEGYRGRILMVTKEQRLPYDRPNLSKGYLSGEAGPGDLPWRTKEFYQDHDIEVLLGRTAARVEPDRKNLTFEDGGSITYDALLLATGGLPRKLEVPGADWPNIFKLRSADDADAILEVAAGATRAVTIGAGFIGMEAAAALTKRGLTVTVVGSGDVPLKQQLGAEIGGLLQAAHEEQGVTFRLGRKVVRFEGDTRARAVVLDDGEVLPADLVVVGLGVTPATGMLQGIPLNDDGSVTVDRNLRVAEGLYAAGDAARFPDWRDDTPIRIEHWRLAAQLGRVAAKNMAGLKVGYIGAPFFWSEQFDLIVQYVGYAAGWDEVVIHGELKERNFLAYYVKGGKVLAAVGLQHDQQLAAISELMRMDKLPGAHEVRQQPGLDMVARLKALQS
jgi:NADPH-dependent 2,4-dienoyl-CoA reductase/sulfur reductase-like enzyme/nitrite reductase/ring-hydroxylating ferredoxin subunit